MRIRVLMQEAFETATQNGFYETPTNFPTRIALMHSELSEALEADRKGDSENLAEELADVVIRVCDTAQHMGIDLEYAIASKMLRNKSRGHRHGGKAY